MYLHIYILLKQQSLRNNIYEFIKIYDFSKNESKLSN